MGATEPVRRDRGGNHARRVRYRRDRLGTRALTVMRDKRRMPETSRPARKVEVLGEPYYTESIELDDEGDLVASSTAVAIASAMC